MARTYKWCEFCSQANKYGYKPHHGKPAFKGCKKSHGRCSVCSDVWDRPPPFFAVRSYQGWKWRKDKSWIKQKGMRKEYSKWVKFDVLSIFR